ncbi:MAG: hypothetical protein NTY77_01885 [Elusimicrobia bacterium]|nr:hypothetical protein [Elusimicrobiota bacterium]
MVSTMILALNMIGAVPIFAGQCAPPSFYTSLPRDREWYYGVAKDPDTDKARLQAIKNLGKQVTGDLEVWDSTDVEKVAGPGRDRWEVAKEVGRLLPQSTLLAGWEQDDFEKCNDYSYVLVRIEKERVKKFVQENAKFKDSVLENLTQRVEKVETDVKTLQDVSEKHEKNLSKNTQSIDTLTKRLNRLETQFVELEKRKTVFSKDKDLHEMHLALRNRIDDVKSVALAGKSPEEFQRKLAMAEGSLSALNERLKKYDEIHQRIMEHKSVLADAERRETVAYANKRLDNGTATFEDITDALDAFKEEGRLSAACEFLHKAINKKSSITKDEMGELESQLVYLAHDNYDIDSVMRDGEAFRRKYPESSQYAQIQHYMAEAESWRRRMSPTQLEALRQEQQADAKELYGPSASLLHGQSRKMRRQSQERVGR